MDVLGQRPDASLRLRQRTVASYLFIVSRRHSELYDYLGERFSEDRNVEVILDRRVGERRARTMLIQVERRRSDRRERPEIDEELHSRPYAVVTLP